MANRLNVADIYDKNLNFLIGSGASFGLLPTLELKVVGSDGSPHTVETLATTLGESDERFIPLFMDYYSRCIRPAQALTIEAFEADTSKAMVLQNYKTFLETVLRMLQRRKPMDRRCNVFTTNYDGCLTFAADDLLRKGAFDFVLNDGAHGFRQRTVQVRNFLNFVMQTGVFERHFVNIPQVNVVHLHGSVYWTKDKDQISVDYGLRTVDEVLPAEVASALGAFSASLLNPGNTVDAIPAPNLPEGVAEAFWERFRKLPIVNPTKWKFHETVFDEHYYQMLRMLSYELEKPNSVLITFGFSFADEHIRSLIKRSLSNPTLKVFICCFNEAESTRLGAEFKAYRNVSLIDAESGFLDFSYFNSSVLSIPLDVSPAPSVVVADAPSQNGSQA